MNSAKYDEWVNALKEGDIVLLMDSGVWSAPVIFLTWNGDSATNGYRAQHLWIPDWEHTRYHWGNDSIEERKRRCKEQWDDTFKDLKDKGTKSMRLHAQTINANAEKRFFPFPTQFLNKDQKKFVKLINTIKGYEY
jgi:hypothetical protein